MITTKQPDTIFDIPQREAAEKVTAPPVREGKKSSAMEQVLASVSGLPKLILPFLVQNIGWFISGFLFISGCIFLVINTEGTLRTFTISSILFGYTLLLMGGAYKLLQHRPELRSTCTVLMSIGMLLIPLSIAASVRLISADATGLTMTGVGIGMLLVNLAVFRWTSGVASGIMDRSLGGIHPTLFMTLTAIQAAAPVLNMVFGWYLLAAIHLVLCGILGTGLIRFTNEWVKSVHTQRRMTAFYALGTLIYAAAVSFLHLALQQKNPLPAGYSAPFIMLLSGFLFYADARFKQWVNRFAFLSKASFGIYGLSIASLVIGFNTPLFGSLTLVIGAAVYGTVFAQYLTLPPLSCLTICLSGLYYQFFLRFLPYDTYFLASLPGLFMLAAMFIKAAKRGAINLIYLGFRTTLFLASGLAAWSLFLYGTPGITATATGAVFTLIIYAALRFHPARWIASDNINDNLEETKTAISKAKLTESSWIYILPLSAVITIAYFPVWPGFSFAAQFSISLSLLAAILTETGIRLYRKQTGQTNKNAEIVLNCALLGAIGAWTVCLWNAPQGLAHATHSHLVLPFISAVFLRQGLVLRLRFLVYLGLIMGGFTGDMIKHVYFSHVSTGMTSLTAMAGVWVLLRRITQKAGKKIRVPSPPPLPIKILWMLKAGKRSVANTISLPLNQGIFVLWGFGIYRFITRLPMAEITLFQILNTAFAMSATLLLLCHFRKFFLWWMPLALGFASLLTALVQTHGMNPPLVMFVSSIYAVSVWTLTQIAISRPGIIRLAETAIPPKTKTGILKQIDGQTRATTFLMALFSLFVTACYWFIYPGATVLPTMMTGTAFFWASGHYYGKPSNIYFMLAMSVFMTLILFADFLALNSVQQILVDSRTRFLTAVMSLLLGAAAWLGNTIKKTKAGSLYRLPMIRMAAFLGMTTILLHFTLTVSGILTGFFFVDSMGLSMTVSLLLPISIFQVFRLHPTRSAAHFFHFSLFSLLINCTFWLWSFAHFPLMLAAWTLVMLSMDFRRKPLLRFASASGLSKHMLILMKATAGWQAFCVWLVIPALLMLPVASFKEGLLTLLVLTASFSLSGWQRSRPFLIWTARLLGLILLHTWPLMFMPPGKAQGQPLWQVFPMIQAQFVRLQVLFPWYALQTVLAVLAFTEVRKRLLRRMPENKKIKKYFFADMTFEILIGLSAWFLHAGVFIHQLGAGITANYPLIQGAAALSAAVLFIGMGIRKGWQTRSPKWVYASFFMTGAAGIYCRLLCTGVSPLNHWDTIILMSGAWGLFMLQRAFQTNFFADPLRRLVMLTPLLSLMTVPFQAESMHASATLLAAGTLYLSVYYTIGGRLALVLGTLAANTAAYLWIPAWADRSHLIQPYVVPAALSVLFLLQLHRKEIKQSTLGRMRLATLSVLYACATLDFFMQPDLGNFILALLLSLTGAGFGIALRIRAFLYGGTAFMVLNVLGQMFFVYSAQNFSKGIVLVLLGTVTMIGMIWFNLKREAILKKVRVFRADLEEWE